MKRVTSKGTAAKSTDGFETLLRTTNHKADSDTEDHVTTACPQLPSAGKNHAETLLLSGYS